jgi:hypothetical protein
MFDISISVDMDLVDIDVFDNNCARSPASVTVIGFMRRQGHPTDIDARIYPGYSSRIPGKSNVKERGSNPNPDPGHGWRPIPKTTYEYPVSIMVGHIPKWLTRYPDILSVTYRPSTHREWCPPHANVNRTPEIRVCAIIVNLFPPAMLFQGVSFIMQARRQVC